MEEPTDYEKTNKYGSLDNLIPRTDYDRLVSKYPWHERRRQDAGLACLLVGGLLGLIAGFLIGLAF
jgi:hypothetical protein